MLVIPFQVFAVAMSHTLLPKIIINPIEGKRAELNFVLCKIYYQPTGYYQTVEMLYNATKEEGYNFNITDVKKWLHKQKIWQIYTLLPKYIPQVSFNGITCPNNYHQADILYMPWDTVKGKVYKYCFNYNRCS